jgi:hypothetical protein
VLVNQVQVGCYRYRIVCDETQLDRFSREDAADLTGRCDRRSLHIYVRPGMAADAEAETVLHEVLHAVCGATGLDDAFADGTVTEEDLVGRLSPALLDLLRRNPKLVGYLTGGKP